VSDYAYENVRRVTYQDGAVFVPVREKCGRFVKSDEFLPVHGLHELRDQPNATCSKHGRVKMLFEGWFDLQTEESA